MKNVTATNNNNLRVMFIIEYTKKIEFLLKKNKYELSKLGNIVPKTEFQLLPKQIELDNAVCKLL